MRKYLAALSLLLASSTAFADFTMPFSISFWSFLTELTSRTTPAYSASYTLTAADANSVVVLSPGSSAITATLPAVANYVAQTFTIYYAGTGTGTITIASGGSTINGNFSGYYVLTNPLDSITVTGTSYGNWVITSLTLHKSPVFVKLTSGTTYTVPTGPSPIAIKATVVGGGGGAGSSGVSETAGTGGSTTFDTITATGGGGGGWNVYSGAGGGGTTGSGSWSGILRYGDPGGSAGGNGSNTGAGGAGGSSCLGGGGQGSATSPNAVGGSGVAGTGGGGAGGSGNTGNNPSSGGGGGGCIIAYSTGSLPTSYTYSIGGGGTAVGSYGGTGGTGAVVLELFYH